MRTKIKTTTLLTVLSTLFYFFPTVYASSVTNTIKYFFLLACIYRIVKDKQYITGNNLFIILPLLYQFTIFFISWYRQLPYANIDNFIAILLLGIYLLYIKISLVRDKVDTVNALHFTFLVLIIWDLMTIIIYPNGISGANSIHGSQFLFGNKNNHTIHLLIYLLVSFWKSSNSDRYQKIRILLSCCLTWIVALLLNSATTIVCVFIAVAGMLLKSFNIFTFDLKAKLVFIGGIVLNFIIILGNAIFLSPVVAWLGKNMTFTNRSIIWDQTIPYIMQKPILGWGHVDTNTTYSMFGYINTHNQFLDSWFYGGILALGILLFTLIRLSQSIDKMESSKDITIISFLLISLLIKMLFEQIASAHIAWFLFMLFFEFSLLSHQTKVDHIP